MNIDLQELDQLAARHPEHLTRPAVGPADPNRDNGHARRVHELTQTVGHVPAGNIGSPVEPPAGPIGAPIVDPPDAPTSKVCHKCGIDKPLTDYWRNATQKDGLQIQCKTCLNARNRESRAATRTVNAAPAPAPAVAPEAPAVPTRDPDVDLDLLTDAIGLLRGRGVGTVKQSKLLKLLDALDLPGMKDTVG